LFIGVDLGTSGCRAVAIDMAGQIQMQLETETPQPYCQGQKVEQEPKVWWQATQRVLKKLSQKINPTQVAAIAIDGTSATLVLVDGQGNPVYPGIMYNDNRATQEAEQIQQVAPKSTAAHGSTATLAKLLWCHHQQLTRPVRYVMHQADWITAQLSGRYGISDVNNCLKLGYDAINQEWPIWLQRLQLPPEWFPQVVEPGTVIGTLKPELSKYFGFLPNTLIIAGTTDSTAALIATGAQNIGEAVTCLGSTLVLKVIAEQPIFEPRYGIYSQPLFHQWLVGGASNTGGAVLLKYFSLAQLQVMTPLLTPTLRTSLDYYPLLSPGERFPISDPQLTPRLTPRPQENIKFFQGLLESITRIERQGYELLHQLGAPYPTKIYTTGGGANNPAWTVMRELELSVPIITNNSTPAAYGTALLAKRKMPLCECCQPDKNN
jgi:sugar (pentulose or hexulose) kinase